MPRGLRILFVPVWLGLGGFLLWVALRQLDPDRFVASLTQVTLLPLLGAILVDVVSVLCKAAKWHLLLRPIGHVSLLKLQATIYAGGAVSIVLPFRLDEAVRATMAARFSGLPAMSIIGSMALERLVDVGVLLGFVLALTWLLPLPGWFNTAVLVTSGVGGVLVALLVMAHLLARTRKLTGVVNRLLDGFAAGSRALMRPHLIALAMGFAGCEWLLTGTVANLVAEASGLSLSVGALILVTTLLFTSFALPLTPAGIGVFEVAMKLVLPRLYGFTEQQAVAMALMMHGLLLAPMALIGTLVIVATGVRLSEVSRFKQA